MYGYYYYVICVFVWDPLIYGHDELSLFRLILSTYYHVAWLLAGDGADGYGQRAGGSAGWMGRTARTAQRATGASLSLSLSLSSYMSRRMNKHCTSTSQRAGRGTDEQGPPLSRWPRGRLGARSKQGAMRWRLRRRGRQGCRQSWRQAWTAAPTTWTAHKRKSASQPASPVLRPAAHPSASPPPKASRVYMRNLPGRLKTMLAQNTLSYLTVQ